MNQPKIENKSKKNYSKSKKAHQLLPPALFSTCLLTDLPPESNSKALINFLRKKFPQFNFHNLEFLSEHPRIALLCMGSNEEAKALVGRNMAFKGSHVHFKRLQSKDYELAERALAFGQTKPSRSRKVLVENIPNGMKISQVREIINRSWNVKNCYMLKNENNTAVLELSSHYEVQECLQMKELRLNYVSLFFSEMNPEPKQRFSSKEKFENSSVKKNIWWKTRAPSSETENPFSSQVVWKNSRGEEVSFQARPEYFNANATTKKKFYSKEFENLQWGNSTHKESLVYDRESDRSSADQKQESLYKNSLRDNLGVKFELSGQSDLDELSSLPRTKRRRAAPLQKNNIKSPSYWDSATRCWNSWKPDSSFQLVRAPNFENFADESRLQSLGNLSLRHTVRFRRNNKNKFFLNELDRSCGTQLQLSEESSPKLAKSEFFSISNLKCKDCKVSKPCAEKKFYDKPDLVENSTLNVFSEIDEREEFEIEDWLALVLFK